MPNKSGRLCNGAQAEMIVKAPFCSPAVPMPATARPTMSIFEELATPQSNDPSSKMEKKVMKLDGDRSALSQIIRSGTTYVHLFLKFT